MIEVLKQGGDKDEKFHVLLKSNFQFLKLPFWNGTKLLLRTASLCITISMVHCQVHLPVLEYESTGQSKKITTFGCDVTPINKKRNAIIALYSDAYRAGCS